MADDPQHKLCAEPGTLGRTFSGGLQAGAQLGGVDAAASLQYQRSWQRLSRLTAAISRSARAGPVCGVGPPAQNVSRTASFAVHGE
jgi:hypothetical protein